ncbi:MAG: hypothetical protein US40_C0005G0022 [Candidatus Roizmanbacteria bacterium GW2011_GWC2_37_13]|uniref:HEPN domain-containing protein n=1 Tax=Candidatus Roizmanbacteria bacterium GW2011_GWC2_37_13 TaxID=1618486 RepID=A0A0G0G723_9BACT|nr:MAG: hypothetical protein US38_C0005G0022 [Candidatus Roizmanbacteria bacterium GW2011_GWC1_37_12]KKQ25852.1 MAG: hypothetical protein US40_C0005G0022 [Candidatus Roizmanbacteria bacterium GW2011_GWC2_37_13]
MKKSEQTHYEWFFYAMSFLGLAKIGCRELINQKYRDKDFLTEDLLYGAEESNSRFLLIPIFFNVKHSLELFIKTVGVNIDGEYRDKHDLDYLLKDLKSRVKNLFKNRNKNEIFQKIEDLKSIVKKYFLYNFLENMNPIRDYNNELFRYPSSKRGINISQELEKFDSTKVGEILNDIKKIHILFISIRGLTNSTKLGHPNPGSWS